MYGRIGAFNHRAKKPFGIIIIFAMAILVLETGIDFLRTPIDLPEVKASRNHLYQSSLKGINNYLAINFESPPIVNAKAYAIFDGINGELLIGKNENIQYPIASITKLVTALTAKSKFKEDDVIEIIPQAINVGGSQLGLKIGEQYYFKDLLKAMIIYSANDAAYAIAYGFDSEHSSIDKFVSSMNSWTKRNGLTNSMFYDPAGLDDRGFSTAIDIAKMTRKVLEDPLLKELVHTVESDISSIDKARTFHLKSTNSLLVSNSPYYTKDAIGVKTGFTYQAGYCLVSAFTYKGRPVIIVVLNTVEFKKNSAAKESRILWNWVKDKIQINYY